MRECKNSRGRVDLSDRFSPARLIAAALVLLLTTGVVARTLAEGDPEYPYRAWTSATGTTLEAHFVRQSGEFVTLQNKDGRRLTIAMLDLSQADKEYVAEILAAQREAADKRRAAFFRQTPPEPEAPPKEVIPEYLSEAEYEVIKEMSLARQDPPAYATWLRQYRDLHIGNNVFRTRFGKISSKEGVAAIDEAIAFLEAQKPLGPLMPSEGLTLAARDHAADIGPAGIVGHTGSDGSGATERIGRRGHWKHMSGENIQFGHGNAREIVMQLIIDDGVPSRGHRLNIFNGAYRVAGVAIGPHSRYGSCCVIDYAGGFSD